MKMQRRSTTYRLESELHRPGFVKEVNTVNMMPIVMIWVVLGVATLGLALYRKFVSANEEDLIHLGPGEERQIPEQAALARKLEAIDRWGKVLTIVTVAMGVAIGIGYMVQAWYDPTSVPNTFFRR